LDLIQIYECLCDRTRLRILALLGGGPLCVCHLQEILGEPQVKISKHLSYLKTRGLVEAKREGNWMMYQLPATPSRELKANLACLQDCASEDAAFHRDTAKLAKLRTRLNKADCPCAMRTTAKRTT
jgi:ArsR family transcriptional regulator, arsenate/arsenite/antimonite-responsive transcriptional repressor